MENNVSEKNYGIYLLKIIATIMVICLHVLGYGGVLSVIKPYSPEYFFGWLLETISYCAVDIFALITGYIYINRKIKLKNIINLWFVVVFYCVIISLVYYIKDSTTSNFVSFIKSFFPVTFCKHWYFKSYFLLYFMIPFINNFLHNLNFKEYNTLLLILLLCCSIQQTIFLGTLYQVSILLVMYIIGAYIRIYESELVVLNLCNITYLLFFILSTLLALLPRVISCLLPLQLQIGGAGLLRYHSPCMILQSTCLLLIFRKIIIDSNAINRIIKGISLSCFSVYIVHAEDHILNSLIVDKFTFLKSYTDIKFILILALVIFAIFIIILFIDKIRVLLFKLIKINDFINLLICKYKKLVCDHNLFIDIEDV